MLVGTALAVIIPEGVRALFSERTVLVTKDYTPEPSINNDLHSVIGISLVLGEIYLNDITIPAYRSPLGKGLVSHGEY